MDLLNAQIVKKNYQSQNTKGHQKKERNVNHQLVLSVEKNCQNHHRLSAKNVEKKYISHMDLMDLMDHMDLHHKEKNQVDLMDHMVHHQTLFALNVVKNLNSLNHQRDKN